MMVTTWMEPEAEALIQDALRKNHIDYEEYPTATAIEEACVHMLGDLCNDPNVDGVALDERVVNSETRLSA